MRTSADSMGSTVGKARDFALAICAQAEHSHTLRLLDECRSRVRGLDSQLATLDAELQAAQNGNGARHFVY